MPLPVTTKLVKILKYRYTIESWKSEADAIKSSLEKVGDLVEGVWNTF